MKQLAAAVVSGLIFGLGLAVSGMVNPAKITGFLDVAGNWDPSLAVVLAAATGTTVLTFGYILKQERPLLDREFHLPTRTDVDFMLVVGAGMFGIGWGIVGFCPGPAYTTLLMGRWETWVFFAAMIAGMAAFRFGGAFVANRRNSQASAE